jgi:hypothetical protein
VYCDKGTNISEEPESSGQPQAEKGMRRREAEATGWQCEKGKDKKNAHMHANIHTIILMKQKF